MRMRVLIMIVRADVLIVIKTLVFDVYAVL